MLIPSLSTNIPKIYTLKFFTMFLVIMPVIVPFFLDLGMGMKGVYLLQSVFAVTVFVLEIPSGYISDLCGRKNTLLISCVLKGIGFTLFAFASGFFDLCIAEVLLGISVSLNSGTDTSLIYDTLEELKSKKAQIKILGKSLFYFSLGEGLASLIASVLLLATFTVKDMVIISAYLSWIPFLIALTLKEPTRAKMGTAHKENVKYIFTNMFKQSRLLNLIILYSIFSFSGTLFAVWVFQKYWENLAIPISYFGFLWALTNFTVSLTSKYAHKVEKKLGSSITLMIIGSLPIAGYLGIGLLDNLFGLLACLCFQVCRGFGSVILKDALNKRVTGDFRATANSIVAMGVRIFYVIGGPVFGLIIDTKGLSHAALGMTVFYVMVCLLVLVPLIKQKENFITIKS